MSEDTEGSGADNAVSKAKIEGLVAEAEDCLDRLDTLRGEYVNLCKGVQEELKAVKDSAKDAGVNRKVFNAILKEKLLDRKKAALTDGMDEDQEDQFDDLRLKLGMLADTPLGNAAETASEKKAAKRKSKSDAVNSLVN